MSDAPFGMSAGRIWSKMLTYCSMSVVPLRPFHACMNSNAVTLLSCGGAVVYTDEEDIFVDALTDATELSSAFDDAAATQSKDAVTD